MHTEYQSAKKHIDCLGRHLFLLLVIIHLIKYNSKIQPNTEQFMIILWIVFIEFNY
jgi:hypothetical protein